MDNTVKLMKLLDQQYREVSGINDPSQYKTFYSRIDPGRLLVLGINPGGDPAAWKQEVGRYYPSSWVTPLLNGDFWFENYEHEYVDCRYPIQQVMNDFLRAILSVGNEDLRKIPKINLAFRRSPDTDSFKDLHGMTLTQGQREATPFVARILEHVAPDVVLLEGMFLDSFRRRLCQKGCHGEQLIEPLTTYWRGNDVRILAAEVLPVTCLGRSIPVIAIGHPSTFGNKPDFVQVRTATGELIKNILCIRNSPQLEPKELSRIFPETDSSQHENRAPQIKFGHRWK